MILTSLIVRDLYPFLHLQIETARNCCKIHFEEQKKG